MNNLTILLVNKDPESNTTLVNELTKLNVSYATVASGNDALTFINQNSPALIYIPETCSDSTAIEFIIRASQMKLFTYSSYGLISEKKLSEMEKIKYMSLGFSYFITTELDNEDIDNLRNAISCEFNTLKAA